MASATDTGGVSLNLLFERCGHDVIWPDDWWERIDRYAQSGNVRLLKYWKDNAGRPGVREGRACPRCPGVRGQWQHCIVV